MPAPAVYVVTTVAIVGAVAAGLVFKEFVYEPHIAPMIEEWAQGFISRRRARRRQRTAHSPVSVHVDELDQEDQRNPESYSRHTSQSIQLETLVDREVRKWRTDDHTLRYRSNGGVSDPMHFLDNPNHHTSFVPHSPTQIIFKTPPSTPSSHSLLRESKPASPNIISRDRSLSRQPIPSLSQSHPFELDQELLSGPSRGESPFSILSHPASPSASPNFHPFSSGSMDPPFRLSSRTLSDLNSLSDAAEHDLADVMSPRSIVSDVSTLDDDPFGDEATSERSASSWINADAGSR